MTQYGSEVSQSVVPLPLAEGVSVPSHDFVKPSIFLVEV